MITMRHLQRGREEVTHGLLRWSDQRQLQDNSNGRRLFFPWGVWGRGYVVGSELDYERLRGQTKIFVIAGMALMLGAIALQRFLLLLLVALYVFYLAWARYSVHGLQQSDERLSLLESMYLQARERSPVLPWVAGIGSIVLVAASVLMFALA